MIQTATAKVTCPEPGVYPDVSARDYHQWDAVSSSMLARLLNGTPADVQTPWKDTDDLRLGRLVHSLLLERDGLDMNWAFMPELNLRKKDDRAERDRFVEEHESASREVADADTLEQAKAIAASVLNDPVCAEILGGKGKSEVSLVWDDKHTGLRLKARVDWLTAYRGRATHVDLKTAKSAAPWKFSYAMKDHGYDLRAFHYLQGAKHAPTKMAKANAVDRDFIFIAVEKEAPFNLGIFQPTKHRIDEMAPVHRQLLETFKKCQESNHWPNRYTGDSPEEI